MGVGPGQRCPAVLTVAAPEEELPCPHCGARGHWPMYVAEQVAQRGRCPDSGLPLAPIEVFGEARRACAVCDCFGYPLTG